MSWLWMSIEPGEQETRLELSEARRGLVLRARLPQMPRQERALAQIWARAEVRFSGQNTPMLPTPEVGGLGFG